MSFEFSIAQFLGLILAGAFGLALLLYRTWPPARKRLDKAVGRKDED